MASALGQLRVPWSEPSPYIRPWRNSLSRRTIEYKTRDTHAQSPTPTCLPTISRVLDAVRAASPRGAPAFSTRNGANCARRLSRLLLLPRAEEVELAELLRQLERLRHHTLLARVVSALNEAGEREVLAEGMTLEAIVGEDAPQVRVALCTYEGQSEERGCRDTIHAAAAPK